ncbi:MULTISPECIES: hypothetical protein [unclassified Streptomyces]|uniref:hypothetical protein n=1 Tax=unclassified Streptomyces TaxID=2593676 RepID=UPI00278BC803|nr:MULTISPECIES: hypothetical protein [unclassified Streptomyces]
MYSCCSSALSPFPPLGGGLGALGDLRVLDADVLHGTLDVVGRLGRGVVAQRVGEDVAVQPAERLRAVVAGLARVGQGLVDAGAVLAEQTGAVGDELLRVGIVVRQVRGRRVAHPAVVVDLEPVRLRPPHGIAQRGLSPQHPDPRGVHDARDGRRLGLDHAQP